MLKVSVVFRINKSLCFKHKMIHLSTNSGMERSLVLYNKALTNQKKRGSGPRPWSLYSCTKFSSNQPCSSIFCRFNAAYLLTFRKINGNGCLVSTAILHLLPFLSFSASLVPLLHTCTPPILALHFLPSLVVEHLSSHLLFPSLHPSSPLASKLQHQ